MRESNGYVVSFLLGGLAGASVAMILTPRTGRKTRQLLVARVRSGERSARRALERGRDAVVTVSERVKDTARAVMPN